MIYRLFWCLANIAIRVFYGKIEVSGIESIPKDGPLLIASNHPNGFLEPIIMACLFPRPLHFMVRGDVFNKPWLRPILLHTNQIPIFRFKDGFSELRKNDASLREAYKALDQDAAIILFIEGGTQPVKTLRPFQKGLARMANSYLDVSKNDKPLQILPVAINFVSPFMLRSRVMLNVGKPYLASDYFQDERTKVRDIRRLTNDLYNQVEPMAFNVKEKSRQDVLNQALRYAEGFFGLPFLPIVSRRTTLWPLLKNVSDGIKNMNEQQYQSFVDEMSTIEQTQPYHVKRTGSTMWSWIGLVLAFVPGILGLLINIIPGLFALSLPKKVLSKDNTVFVASIILSSGVGFFVIYYLLTIGIVSLFLGWKSLLILLGCPLGFVYLYWKNCYRSTLAKSTYQLSDEMKDKVTMLFSNHGIDLKNMPA